MFFPIIFLQWKRRYSFCTPPLAAGWPVPLFPKPMQRSRRKLRSRWVKFRGLPPQRLGLCDLAGLATLRCHVTGFRRPYLHHRGSSHREPVCFFYYHYHNSWLFSMQTSPAELSVLERGLVVSDPHWKDIVREEKRYCVLIKKTFQGQVLGYVTPVSTLISGFIHSRTPFLLCWRSALDSHNNFPQVLQDSVTLSVRNIHQRKSCNWGRNALKCLAQEFQSFPQFKQIKDEIQPYINMATPGCKGNWWLQLIITFFFLLVEFPWVRHCQAVWHQDDLTVSGLASAPPQGTWNLWRYWTPWSRPR